MYEPLAHGIDAFRRAPLLLHFTAEPFEYPRSDRPDSVLQVGPCSVPVCAVPFGRDQLEVARRVELSGAGTRVSAMRLTPGRLRAAVHRTLECRPGAERIARAFAQAGGPPRAAGALEALVGSGRPLAASRSRP